MHNNALQDRGVMKKEELQILIGDHAGKKNQIQKIITNLDWLIVLWLDVQEKKAFVPKEEWTQTDNFDLVRMEIEEIMIDKTQVGRKVKKLLQGCMGLV